MNTQRPLLALALSALTLAAGARAEENLTDLDLATLMSMDVTVTSASRRAQSAHDAAAAVYVITREDIRRSGAATLPEILRMAPGVHVGRVNTRSWAVTTRGFSNRFANKLLVMVDGRSIYTSAFSGVMWEEQPVFLEDIERIEIVRGPGGALWGVNAVNGVINIITRSASATHGVLATAGGGTMQEQSAAVRFGDRAQVGDYRVYVDHSNTEPMSASDGDWKHTQGGFRLDRDAAGGSLTLQGDVHEADFGVVDGHPEMGLSQTAQTGSAVASWTRDYAPGQLELRTYYSWTERGEPVQWNESAAAVEAQFAARRVGRHQLTAGVGLRRAQDEQARDSSTFARIASTRDQWSVYGQDEIDFLDQRLRIIAGAKIEDTGLGGAEFQPTLRALVAPVEAHTFWTAASRAVRAPARFELDSHLRLPLPASIAPGPLPAYFEINGAQELDGESLNAYELGWRWRPDEQVSLDVAAYRNDYDQLIRLRSLPPQVVFFPSPYVLQPLEFVNGGSARTEGVEATLEWAARDWLRFQAFGAWHTVSDVNVAPDTGLTVNGKDPGRTLSARARIDLPHETELDLSWRGLSATHDGGIAGYDAINVRLGWRPIESVEVSLAVENLLDEEHIEAENYIAGVLGIELDRSYFARIVWRPFR